MGTDATNPLPAPTDDRDDGGRLTRRRRPWAWPWPRRRRPSATATSRWGRSPWSADGSSPPGTTSGRCGAIRPPTPSCWPCRTPPPSLGTWRLSEVTLVVTLEPCPMCAGGLVAARLGRLVFGAADLKAGACGSLYNLCADPRLNHEVAVTAGVRADEASDQLSEFFAGRRTGGGKATPPADLRPTGPAAGGATPTSRPFHRSERLRPRTASSSLTPGEMPERTNGHASKACEVHSLRGFESPSLRSLGGAHERLRTPPPSAAGLRPAHRLGFLLHSLVKLTGLLAVAVPQRAGVRLHLAPEFVDIVVEPLPGRLTANPDGAADDLPPSRRLRSPH